MNIYLIVSETIYNTEKKLKELTKDISNIVTYNLVENTIDEVLQEASYFSMFDDKKCIIVKNATFFGNDKNSEDVDKILKYINEENVSSRIIFIYNGKCDIKKNLYKIINSNGHAFIYKSMTKTEMKNELEKIVNSYKYKIEDKSLWHIINNSLANFDLCINELNKIMLYYGDPCMINYNDVINIVSRTIEDNNFKLVDSIITRDLNSSLKLLQDMKILKGEPNIVLALLYREFKLMLSILLYEKNNYNHTDILKELKLAEWQYSKIIEHLRLYNLREIKEEIIKLSYLDYKFKSGLINKDVLLVGYIMDLCG